MATRTDARLRNLERDVELWAWLSLHYFEQLCPPDDEGRRKPGERARWIPAVDDYRKYYRHLVAGPYRIYRAHRDNPSRVMAVLAGPVDQPGDIAEQLASRHEIVTNKAAMALATALYIDPATGSPKKGAAGRGPGSARRLADILNQFDLTWDLYAMDAAAMQTMMPKEFVGLRRYWITELMRYDRQVCAAILAVHVDLVESCAFGWSMQ